jgi:hypothetical protein
VPADDPEAALPLHGPNQWPREDLLPGFRAAVTAYFDELTALGHKLLRLLALSLKLPGVSERACWIACAQITRTSTHCAVLYLLGVVRRRAAQLAVPASSCELRDPMRPSSKKLPGCVPVGSHQATMSRAAALTGMQGPAS